MYNVKEIVADCKLNSLMEEAYNYAKAFSGCAKVHVGAMLISDTLNCQSYGANVTLPVSCRKYGCRRQELYGEDSKLHRLPSDCRAIHAEIDCITKYCNKMKHANFSTPEALWILVTRYPCEACARAIVNCGFINVVIYGGEQDISEETGRIFDSAGIQVLHFDWKPEFDTTR